jgi:hypothetical protein
MGYTYYMLHPRVNTIKPLDLEAIHDIIIDIIYFLDFTGVLDFF